MIAENNFGVLWKNVKDISVCDDSVCVVFLCSDNTSWYR